ncbi:hypothetical protein SHLO109777_10310 [Shewanella loihica]|uniref:Uncharacterized protein n=1 Tax=Shewanella loihica (strain ATCC BAA-1088 / PV-4) TaxID=323850 RepID=A3QAN4_SHELP|nr:hypothetical protein [Shewanella loihica]ABO22532.1 conserved hypothetical protein [Shewanella loihica PV-4]
MIPETLLIASAWFWAPMPQGQALVCQTSHVQECLGQLPSNARAQLPLNPQTLLSQMGRRGAMVRPLTDADITGLVLLHDERIPKAYSALWNGQVYALPIEQAYQMTLAHELGHLAVSRSSSVYLKADRLTPYQHEWLADFYLLWSLAREGQAETLAWQQYHRRNLEVFESVTAISHWSTPMLAQLLDRYSWQALGAFEHFDSLIDAIYPELVQYDQETLDEFASLLHWLFGAANQAKLPQYMFWRRAEMGAFIRPTLRQLMGEQAAENWMTQQAMQGE